MNLRSVATASRFRSVDERRHLTVNPTTRTDVLRMIKRRALAAGLWDAENEAQAREWGGFVAQMIGGRFRPENRRQFPLDSFLRHPDVSLLDLDPDDVPAAAGGS